MDTIRKEDLIYTYSWSSYDQDDPRVSGIPDATAFNRHEGQEILYLINYLTDHVAWGVESFGSKMEQLIHDQLPEESTSQQETIQWIREHWQKACIKHT